MTKSMKSVAVLLLATGLGFPTKTHAEIGPMKSISQVTQQASRLTGVVEDELGPLTGASVLIKGTTNGSITDLDGKFTLENVKNGDVIIISYIGFIPQEIRYTGQTILNIKLIEDAQALSEVVVTALGMSRDKKALGYSMTELKGDEIAKANVVNPVTGLQGKVAGVQINMGTAGPQSSQRILIRGNTSMSGNNQPIFVIDGIIIDNDVTKTGGKDDRDFGNDLKNLNADDFETMSVLKGAAATALYGSRASNGVILITTKKGKKGDGLGISFSHTQQWEKAYGFPDFQNEFGMGAYPLWPVDSDGKDVRDIQSGRNFGPRYDYKPYKVDGKYDAIHQPYKDNLKQMYETGRFINTNLAVSGGTEKSTYRFSFSNMQSEGMTFNNSFDRNNFSLNVTHDLNKFMNVESGFTYTYSKGVNPTFQGGDKSPVYDFTYSVPRDYDTAYWLKNYWSVKGDGYNGDDPFGYSGTLFDYLENNEIQREENYRGYVGLNVTFTNWLKLVIKGDMNRSYIKNEAKVLANDKQNFDKAKYELKESKKLQTKFTAMLTANHRFNDLSVSGSLAVERFDEEQSYHNSKTNNGLRMPGVFQLNNSVDPATTEAFAKIKEKRMNSAYGFINLDWKGQIFVDITGRNDWSSTLRYGNGTGNVSYFYPSVGVSWIATESFRDKIPSAISFLKLRGSYAIVGKDCDPYLITNPGTYEYENIFSNDKFDGGSYAYFKFANQNLGAANLKPEKQHAIEFGLDYRMFNNRLGFDIAYYKTNTKNQILALPTSREAGVEKRIINAGNIQNAGIEVLISGTPIQSKNWHWDMSLSLTHNKNKIIKLYPGVTKYELGGSFDTSAWATEGGAYGDIYSVAAYKKDDKTGEILLDENGKWQRSVDHVKVGSIQPKLLMGFTTSLSWKNLTFGMVLDARFGGDVFSGSYNYGMSGGRLKSSLHGRTQEYGGLKRTMDDGRVVYDGMIPHGVFMKNKQTEDLGIVGMTYQEAYEKGIVDPLSAYSYYANMFDWQTGIREASIHKVSWIAVREVSLHWDIPRKWTQKAFIKGASLGFNVRNLGFLYNSLPDNINPEGLQSNYSFEYIEGGGTALSRNYGIKLNLTF